MHVDTTDLGQVDSDHVFGEGLRARLKRPRPDAFPSELLTPELVMVSPPEFASWARAQVPDPSPAAPHPQQPARGVVRVGLHPRRVAVRTLLSLAALVLALALLGLATATPTSERDATRMQGALGSTPARATVSRSAVRPALLNVRAPTLETDLHRAVPRKPATLGTRGATKTKEPRDAPAGPGTELSSVVLLWKAAGALGYWVALARVHSGRQEVILTFETDEPRLVLPATWPNAGRRQRLTPGRYHWYVWARARDNGRGARVAQGAITITQAQAAAAA